MIREDWLKLTTEEILEPDLPICDPHHHLWDHPGSRYLLDELLVDTGSGHNVVSTVFVECASMYRQHGPAAYRSLGETEFVNGVAAMAASGDYGPTRACAGIVSYADLTLGAAVGEVLDAHLAASPRFRGIRHAVSWHASEEIRNAHTSPREGLLLDRDFREGFAQLGPRGLSFDAWLYHTQISELTDLARAFPDVTIVFDHFGGPLGIGPYRGRQDELFGQWCQDVTALAQCPNVVAKLGGIVMAVNGFGFHKQAQPPDSQAIAVVTGRYHLHAIEAFGPERCMFESNFPVDKVSASYAVLWNAFKRIAAGASDSEKAALFHDTAHRVYRLEDSP